MLADRDRRESTNQSTALRPEPFSRDEGRGRAFAPLVRLGDTIQ